MGLSTRNLQQYQRAIEDYDRAIQLKPDYADAYNNRGNAYRRLDSNTSVPSRTMTAPSRLKADYATAY
ncbi:MAG UNVERIFIED_CONTAM: tetratricopeptide repeat protein [Anaerolineae bacterium]